MSQTSTYTVTGMTCGHCVASVTEEVQEIAGVENVEVVLETGAVTVTSAEPIDEAAVRAAVEEAGYQTRMSTSTRVVGFVVALAAMFALALGVGNAFGPASDRATGRRRPCRPRVRSARCRAGR